MRVMDRYDIAIIGAGPGGYVAAIRAAQLGFKTAVVERDRPGGVCLNWGCIPSKAILKSAELYRALNEEASLHGIRAQGMELDYSQVIRRSRGVAERLVRGVESLFKKHGVTIIKGTARLDGGSRLAVSPAEGGKGTSSIEARRLIVATGSTDRMLPGLERDGKSIITSRDALALAELPTSLAVIGGGAVGVEFAYIFNCFGVKVTLVEMEEQLLPGSDREVALELARCLKKQGIAIMTGTRFERLERAGGTVKLVASCGGQRREIECERVLVAVGRVPLSEGLGLEGAGVEIRDGFIKVDQRFQTSRSSVLAIGDVIGPPLLAHVASEEGIAAVEFLAEKRERQVDYQSIPTCTYCQPEVASVGLTGERAGELGIETLTGRFPLRASGKAVAAGHTDGFVKIVVEKETHQVIGCHIIGSGATEMIAEAGILLTLEATTAELAQTVHAHPTLSEALMEAALAVEGGSINF